MRSWATGVHELSDGFEELGQGTLWGLVPYELIVFAILAIGFTVVLHRTVIGRRLFAYGNNPTLRATAASPSTRIGSGYSRSPER